MDFLEKIDKSFYNFSEFYHLDSVPRKKILFIVFFHWILYICSFYKRSTYDTIC